MEKQTILVPNITCGHCVMAIKKELAAMKGVSKVDGDPGKKTITVEFDAPATIDMIKETLKDINYSAA